MINTTDLQEVEVLLPGDWQREDNGDIYSFTADNMEMVDDQLLRQVIIRHKGLEPEYLKYTMTIRDEYCGLLIGSVEYIITEISSKDMTWEITTATGIEAVIRLHLHAS